MMILNRKNMRKTLIGAAVMALFATGCQNEVLIEKEQVQGELFTLEVNKGMNSRTVLNGNATWWSENDKIN